jgi:hypothetical protein
MLGTKIVRRQQTDKRRVFARILASLKKLALKEKWYIRVNYGKYKDNFGKLVDFYNDGEYTNKTELMKAYKAFIE